MKFLNKLNLFTDRLTLKKEFTCFCLRTRNKHLLETCVGFVFLVIVLHTSVTFFSFSQNHKSHRPNRQFGITFHLFKNKQTKKQKNVSWNFFTRRFTVGKILAITFTLPKEGERMSSFQCLLVFLKDEAMKKVY